jgi:hypothetical protein
VHEEEAPSRKEELCGQGKNREVRPANGAASGWALWEGGTMTRLLLTFTGVLLVSCVLAAPAGASFGLEGFDVTYTNQDGSPATQAGSHPFQMTTSVYFNGFQTRESQGEVKDVFAQQIAGLVADPTAIPRCANVDFLTFTPGGAPSQCPDSTAVGYAATELSVLRNDSPVYNLVPPPGVVLKLGFIAANTPVTIEVGLKDHPPYNGSAVITNIPQTVGVFASVVTLWGDPADPAHDPFRGKCVADASPGKEPLTPYGPYPGVASYGNCPTNVPNIPFLTLPRACEGPLASSYATDSWQHPGVRLSNGEPDLGDPNWAHGSVLTHDGAQPSNPLGMTGCAKLGFNPSVSSQPTSFAAQSPTGLDFALNVHDEGLTSPTGIAQSDIKKTVVTLPEGMTANPSLAEGLNVCSEEDLARETIKSLPGEGCPNESKIGTVEVKSPLIDEPLKGSLYIAKPYQNPFGSLLALYFVIKNPTLGIIVKQSAEVVPDPQTGQLVTTVDNIPQLPFSHFTLQFREGSRSPLVTPSACGTYTTKTVLTPWAGGQPITTNSAFQITAGTNAGPCPAGGVPSLAPQATVGTLNNNAGNYSPLYLRITRKDGEQELTRFSTTLPPGLTGNLSGIPFCPDSAIEGARHKTGTQEINEPSCPGVSEIGHTLVGAGVGGVLAWAPGKIYLAGPYNGSPLSVVSITSAKVGPFDLGTVVIRFGLHIDPNTAQVNIDSAGSDPIPHIIDGIVVNVREIHAYIDRNKFILNPTNCNPLSIQNAISGAGANFTSPMDDVTVTLNSPFQAADCSNLAFKPSFNVSTSGKTSKASGASLTVKLAYPNAPQGSQANIRSVKVDLPKQLPSRLTTLQKACTAAQFHTNPAGCPAASVVGYARAITPILPVPLEGPAYFVSNGGEAFPNLIMVLQGYGLTINLTGNTFINKAGVTSSTFPAIPDQPVTSFELTLPQGPHSALAANGNLCTSKLTTPNTFIGQNGTTFSQNTKVTVTGCPKTKTLTRAQKLTLALKACHKKPKGAKRKACEHQAHKKYGPVKKKRKK